MTTYNVSNASQLMTALAAAHGGDTISLASGNYGDVVAGSLNYASNVTIVSANSAHPAVFHSIHLQNSQNITLTGIDIALTPTSTSMSYTSGLAIMGSHNIVFSNSVVTGGLAINGVAQNATALDATGNVLGLPTGLGISVIGSTGITLSGNSITNLDRGISFSSANSVSVLNNNISNLRQTSINGGDMSNVTIQGNTLSDNNPWALGKSYGDHGDFIHLWTTPPAQTLASANINISNNIISQGAGAPILGINLNAYDSSGGQSPDALGFTNVTINNNAIFLANNQGMRLENVANSVVSNNTLLEPAGGTAQAAPGILFELGHSTNNLISGNIVGSLYNQSSTADATNTYTANQIAQDVNQGGVSFYSLAVLAQASGLTDPAAIHALILNALPQTTTTALYSNAAANIGANFDALNGNAAVTSIKVSDNAPVVLSVAQWQHDARAMGELVNANGTAAHLTISDKAINLAAALDAISNSNVVTSVTVSDSQTLTISAYQAAADGNAITELRNASGAAIAINVKDTGANISSNFASLAAMTQLRCVTVSDAGIVNVSAGQYDSEQSVFTKFSGAFTTDVRDTAANISATIDQLNAMDKLGSSRHFLSVVVSDNQAVQMTVAQMTADTMVTSRLINADGSRVSEVISDTGSDISKAIDTLNRTAAVTAIHVTDGAAITLTAVQATADAAALAKVTGAHTVDVTNITGQPYTSEVLTYSSAGALISTNYLNSHGAPTVIAPVQGTGVGSVALGTIAASNGETFVFNTGFTSETISGFSASADALDFNHAIFSTAARALATATNDGHGDVIFHVGTNETITLLGVTTAQLSANTSWFHSI